MRLLTGNDLLSGDVLWWAGDQWSRHVAHAVDVGAAGAATAAAEEAARHVNMPYLIDAAPGPDGPVLRQMKERIRAHGPSIRPDLGVAAEDMTAGSWVI